VLVVSGDLTQRARAQQFRQARAFLGTLPGPQIIVPGNHDVPLHDVFSRFLAPLRNYRHFITHDLEPALIDREIAVVGVNTARSFTFKGGRINHEQVERVRAILCELPRSLMKIVVTHHPFDMPAHWRDDQIVGRAPMAMRMFARCGADILLAGHLHMSHAGASTARYSVKGYAALVVQAGTATSTRARGEMNSFNMLSIEGSAVRVDRYTWQPGAHAFALAHSEGFERTAQGWAESAARIDRSAPPGVL
jgi:3',5'-cyclic AMP phosphodiesterase CpdA